MTGAASVQAWAPVSYNKNNHANNDLTIVIIIYRLPKNSTLRLDFKYNNYELCVKYCMMFRKCLLKIVFVVEYDGDYYILYISILLFSLSSRNSKNLNIL